MPRKIPFHKELQRGKRLREEREKIWKSRVDFGKSTNISGWTLEGWEQRGVDISCDALAVIAENGGDVAYILTGKRSSHLPEECGILNDNSQNSRVAELEIRVSEQRELIEEQRERIKLQKEKIEELRDKLADFGRGASVG